MKYTILSYTILSVVAVALVIISWFIIGCFIVTNKAIDGTPSTAIDSPTSLAKEAVTPAANDVYKITDNVKGCAIDKSGVVHFFGNVVNLDDIYLIYIAANADDKRICFVHKDNHITCIPAKPGRYTGEPPWENRSWYIGKAARDKFQ